MTPDVAVGPAGDVVVVWAQADRATWTVDAVVRPAGGPWGPLQPLSTPAGSVASPRVALSGSNAAVVWVQSDGQNLIVQACERDLTTGAWTTQASLSAPGQDAVAPRIAVDARGDAVAVWGSDSLAGQSVEAAYRPAGGSWQTAVTLESGEAATPSPDVVLDADGNATAVWASDTGSGWQVRAAHRGSDGTWSNAAALSGPTNAASVQPHLALQGTGDVVAVWATPSGTAGTGTAVDLSTRDARTGRWTRQQQLFTSAASLLAPLIVTDRRGDGLIVWTGSNSSGLNVSALYRRKGGAWSGPRTLASSESGPFSPAVALDASGNAIVDWAVFVNGTSRVQVSELNAGTAAWTRPKTLSRAGGDALTPQVAVGADGDGAAAWARFNGAAFVVQAAGFDASGPALSRVSIPSTGIVRKRLVFSISPKDNWSVVRSVRWIFGDGTSADGKVAGHAYGKPGRYAVRVTATDGFGHVATLRRFVTVGTR